ncbi:MAG: hypothetical protein IKO83_01545 [Oscillospiraceae bacterium]|nr:hypothetical protein [Oscillospiraceae bacterium]
MPAARCNCGRSVFVGAFDFLTFAAAERAAAERWELSDAEREMVALIDAKCQK